MRNSNILYIYCVEIYPKNSSLKVVVNSSVHVLNLCTFISLGLSFSIFLKLLLKTNASHIYSYTNL